jgi:hypothetical protein
MKVLSLIQPWASLIAFDEKHIETRSWATKYRGPLLIHASKKIDKIACLEANIWNALNRQSLTGAIKLPTGLIISKCNLVDCVKVEQTDGLMAWLEKGYVADDQEYPFGNYTPGRYGWILKDIEMLSAPIPAKGQLGLWEYGGEL